MHEIAVIDNIMRISLEVARENQLQHIGKIHLNIGKMQHLNIEIMEHAFSAVKKDTLAKEAELIVEWLPVIIKCRNCGKINTLQENIFVCPLCRSKFTEIVQGNELLVKSIEGK